MASQIGDTREYTHVDEDTSPKKRGCPQCQVNVVPRGINSTRESASGEKHCPNCGYIFGREKALVKHIAVTGAGNAITIATDNGTLQMSAVPTPFYADNLGYTWSIVNGTGNATISAGGLVTAVANGTVTVKATANDGSGVEGTLQLTLSNQV